MEEKEPFVIQTELVGIKNLKSTHNWRLEFDVYEIDNEKVAELVSKINESFRMVLVNG
jgi:hypothetical protein